MVALSLLLSLATAPAHGFDGGALRFDLAVGAEIAFPNVDVGVGYSLDPAYHLNDHLAVGFHWGSTLLFAALDDVPRTYATRSFQPSAEVHFFKGLVRPFLGMSAGLYQVRERPFVGYACLWGTDGCQPLSERLFGVSWQLGVAVHRFYLAGRFHLMTRTAVLDEHSTWTPEGGEIWGYVSIEEGICLGGGCLVR